MLNKNDKKDIFVVILVLLIIIGVFTSIRGCEHLQKEEVSIIDETPAEVEDNQIDEEKENPGQSEEISISNSINNKVVEEENITEKKEKYPIINIEQTNYIISFGDDFNIPQIEALDDAGNSLKISITYSFKSLNSSEFVPTLEFSTRKVGIYKVTYYVENVDHYVSTKDIYIEIIDTELPTAEGIISKYNVVEDIYEYLPIISGSKINTSIDITFHDNDTVSYVEYYNASVDNTIIGDTLEQEAMPNIISVDPNSILTLSEAGEYHIRIYDESGNVFEYIVTIDLQLPTTEVTYEQVADDLVLVTITSDEEMKELDGFTLSNDKRILTKIYSTDILEDIILEDLAGNGILVHLEYEGLTVKVMQNNRITNSRNLNQNDGIIQLLLSGSESIEITYSIDDGMVYTYTNGDSLTQDGFYKFYISHGSYETTLELSISSMGTND